MSDTTMQKRPDSHTVAAGEDFATIAERYGYKSWEPVFYHPANDALRRLRKTAFQLAEGDEVKLPKLECLERVCATGKRHTFRLQKPSLETPLNIAFEDHFGAPYAECDFELKVESDEGMQTISGTTDAGGWIHEKVPVSATSGEIKLKISDDPETWETWVLEIGSLPPIDTETGQAQRLVNLGFLAEEKKTDADCISQALTDFQLKHGLPEDETVEALQQVHGS